MASLEGFFKALSVEKYARGGFDKWVIDDFLIFEMGKALPGWSFRLFLKMLPAVCGSVRIGSYPLSE
jgi:hypothetical protein